MGISTVDRWLVRSDKDVEFTGALVQNAMELESYGTIPTPKVVITGLTILSDQNLSWRIIFFGDSGADDTDADLDTMVASFDLIDTTGFQIAGAGLFRYSLSGLEFRYAPEGRQLHVGLMNLSAGSKNAGVTGEIVLEVSGPLI